MQPPDVMPMHPAKRRELESNDRLPPTRLRGPAHWLSLLIPADRLGETFPVTNGSELRPRIRVAAKFSEFLPRDQRAISIASRIVWALTFDAHCRPTIMWLNASIMKHM